MFPFELVYDHFAQALVGKKLDGDLPPLVAHVIVEDCRIAKCELIDPVIAHQLFASDLSTRMMDLTIRKTVKAAPLPGFCIVTVCEAYARTLHDETPAQVRAMLTGKRSIANDPQTREVIRITLQAKDGDHVGQLPVGPDRVVGYAPLQLDAKSLTTGAAGLIARPIHNEQRKVH